MLSFSSSVLEYLPAKKHDAAAKKTRRVERIDLISGRLVCLFAPSTKE